MERLREEGEEVDFSESSYEGVDLVRWSFVVWEMKLVYDLRMMLCEDQKAEDNRASGAADAVHGD